MQYAPGPSLHVESLQTLFAGQSSESRQRPGADAGPEGGSTPALGIVQVLDPPPGAVARQSAPCPHW